MRRTYIGFIGLICFAVSVGFALAQTSGPITGQWTISGPIVADQVQLSIRRYTPGSNMSSSSQVSITQLNGLTRAQFASPVSSLARFDIVRDAGTLRLEGYLQNGSGGGNFTFIPNPGYANEMRALGYTDLTDERIFQLATHDVSLAYIRSMFSAGIRPESTSKLITMRIHNVSVEFVNEMKALGFTDLKPDKLVTMRIHGVTAEFGRSLKSMGYNSVSTDQMVTMRIHGVSTDFIREIESFGYNHPPIDKLVTMKIHGITPDYIRKAQARGFTNLSIDQLVQLKIHGILE